MSDKPLREYILVLDWEEFERAKSFEDYVVITESAFDGFNI